MDSSEFDRRFPDSAEAEATAGMVADSNAVADAAREFADLVLTAVPAGREQSLALTKIEEAVAWAKAGIARGL